jgi:hypothetical protein
MIGELGPRAEGPDEHAAPPMIESAIATSADGGGDFGAA